MRALYTKYEKSKKKEDKSVARSHEGVQKFSARSMNILRQVAEGKSGRIALEKYFPGFVIVSVSFPISKRSGDGSVRGTRNKNVLSGVLDVWATVFAVRGRFGMEAAAVFARGGVAGQGAGHTARGLNVICRQVKEERSVLLVDEVRFEQPAFSPDREPAAAFVRLGSSLKAPV